jgi:transcription factor SPN1
VFGGSDSELSEYEGKIFFTLPRLPVRLKFCPDVQQQQAVALPPPPPGHSKPRDEYESSGGDSEDDYVQERPQSTKTKKRSSLGRKPTESGEQRKRKRKQPPPPVDFSDLPPEQGKSPMKACVIYVITLTFLLSKQAPLGHENRRNFKK